MCGIAGWVGDGGEAKSAVARMTASLARRGPDAEGIDCWPGAVLGHRRLSIFDLSEAGRQPMKTEDGRVGIVFNGAIYNFRELRKELETKGVAFRSQTDTEVLLKGYLAWGFQDLLRRIQGMFAFALWDAQDGSLWLVRDRLGVKPLHYAVENGRIAFASTARALRAAGVTRGLDELAVAEFLQRGYVSDARSIWAGASKLNAGHYLKWRDGRIEELEEYWRPPQVEDRRLSLEEAAEEAERVLLEAVKRRLDADVPVGSLLSGGIDSGLVCWAIGQLGADVTAFTVSTPAEASDESAEAAQTAKELKLRHEVIAISGDDQPDIQELVEAYGEPFACASALGMLRVSSAVRRSATVLLTGDGGDDVFLGYPEHRACWVAQRAAHLLPEAGETSFRKLGELLRKTPRAKKAATVLELSTRGIAGWQSLQERYSYYVSTGMLGDRLNAVAVPEFPSADSLREGRNLMAAFLEQDRKVRFTGEYMTKVDGGTMHYALEARSPFLDQQMWEFAARLPYATRLHRGELKAVLRQVARKRLGKPTANARKRGFTIPVGRWMAGPWRAAASASFEESVLHREGLIRKEAVLQELQMDRTEAPLQLWYLYVLESWLRHEQGSGSSL